MQRTILFLAAALFLLIGGPASATLLFTVSNADNPSCGSHGLWTAGSTIGSINTSGCGSYFSVDSANSTLVIDEINLTAILDMRVINASGFVAEVNLTFSDFAETHSPYKVEGGANYTPGEAPTGDDLTGVLALPGNGDIDFLRAVTGNITFFDLANVLVATVDVNAFETDGGGNPYAFQFGDGANAKSPTAYGGSAWIKPVLNGTPFAQSHWDLNLAFTAQPSPGVIPEPATLWLSGLGLLAAARARRQRQKT